MSCDVWAIRGLFGEIVDAWLVSEASLDQEFLVGSEFEAAAKRRDAAVAEWFSRLVQALPSESVGGESQ